MSGISEKGISYNAAFFMLIAFAIAGMMLASLLSIPIIMLISGKEMSAVKELVSNPSYFREMQIMQSLSAILGFFIPTLFTASRLSRQPLALTGFKGKVTGSQVALTIVIIGFGLALSSSLGYASYQWPLPETWKIYFDKMEENYITMAANLIRLDSFAELFISIIVLAAIPALCEETLFRGGLQNYLYRSTGRKWVSILIVGLIFSIVHFSFYGFLSRVALAAILGLLYHYSGKLWLPILAHFINNAVAIFVLYFQKPGGKKIVEVLSDKEGSYIGLISIPILIFLFARFRLACINHKVADGI